MKITRKQRDLFYGLLFITPNIIGFLSFTVIPLVLSFIMAFTDWDLKKHNMFKAASVKFIGFDNFIQLIQHPDFWRFLGNTLFFMMGIPISIAGSLFLALLLSKDMQRKNRKIYGYIIASAVFISSILILVAINQAASAMTILILSVLCGSLILGTLGGSVVYRTLFYLPSFTSGVATYILWKKLYNPYTGPINNVLTPVLDKISFLGTHIPETYFHFFFYILIMFILFATALGFSKLKEMLIRKELSYKIAFIPISLILLPTIVAISYSWLPTGNYILIIGAVCIFLYNLYDVISKSETPLVIKDSFGSALAMSLLIMAIEFILIGIGIIIYELPQKAAVGLQPPLWLTEYNWAKPAIMIMAIWGGIGSNNMLLYLAGITNVPQQLYEAADIDGASPFQKFWAVTWPQLAPTTFFIFIMSVIGGLQGGFAMAKTMTNGGPAGATTTLSYFIYTEGFETGRLAYSSAVAWVLFIMVFLVTMFNWKFGNKYVGD